MVVERKGGLVESLERTAVYLRRRLNNSIANGALIGCLIIRLLDLPALRRAASYNFNTVLRLELLASLQLQHVR